MRYVRYMRYLCSVPLRTLRPLQALGKIDSEGVWIEQLETDPAQYLPEVADSSLGGDVVSIDLNRPMPHVLEELSRCPVKTRLSLTGTLVVARDIAHAKLQARARDVPTM